MIGKMVQESVTHRPQPLWIRLSFWQGILIARLESNKVLVEIMYYLLGFGRNG